MKGFRRSQSHLRQQYKVRWKTLKTKLFSEKVIPPQIASKRYLRFSRLTKVPIIGPNRIMGVPKRHIWTKLNAEHYQIQFAYKKVFHSRIHFGKDGLTPHNSTKKLMAKNINHVWKHASPHCTTRKVFFWTCCSSASQKHFLFKVERSLGNAENTNTVENKVALQIDVDEILFFLRISI